MNKRDLIRETISEFCFEKDIDLEGEEIDELLEALEACFEYANYSVATPSSSPEIKRLKHELEVERNKIICPNCKGRGEEVSYGPHHNAYSKCSRCKGTGKVSP